MTLNYNNYLNYELPVNWCSDQEDECLHIYDPHGVGAMTVSSFNILKLNSSLEEHISVMAKNFINQNRIMLHAPLILYGTEMNRTILCGTGVAPDGWFVKLWILAKLPKVLVVTYQCEKKTSEVKKCDAIIESMRFTF